MQYLSLKHHHKSHVIKGTGKIRRGSGSIEQKLQKCQKQQLMSLHYYSDALGLTFGNTNEEVYNIDQIKRWAPLDQEGPKWLEPPGPLRMSLLKDY